MDRTQGKMFWSLSVTLAVEKRRSWPDCETQLTLSCSQIWKQKAPERNVDFSKNICSKTISSEQPACQRCTCYTLYIQSSIWMRRCFTLWVKSDLHGGAGEGVHNTLGQRARGRRFHHLLVLWSRHWSQNAHYNLISSWFLTADKVLLKLFYCTCQHHPDLPFWSGVWGTLSIPMLSG